MKLSSRSNGTPVAVKDSAAKSRVNLHLPVQQIHLKLHTSVAFAETLWENITCLFAVKTSLAPFK